MTFRNRLQYFLVKKFRISNKEALAMIVEGKIILNGEVCSQNVEISLTDEIKYEDELLQIGKKMLYYAYYKPRGIETTFNEAIPNNLKQSLPIIGDDIFPIGRLDKESEGLLLLSNDGSIYDKILRNEHKIEKEYLVEVNRPITEDFIQKMKSGIEIMGKKTLPCTVIPCENNSFKIILVQGLNRQIRRMCYKLNYEVLSLKRIRIGRILLGELQSNHYFSFDKKELFD